MNKMKLHSPDLSQENITKIRDLFPGCVAEAADESGLMSNVISVAVFHISSILIEN